MATSTTSATSSLVCRCSVPCKLQAVSKRGQNEGRKFYGCGQFPEGNCGFFKWENEVAPSSALCVTCEELKMLLIEKDKELNKFYEKLKKMKEKKRELGRKVEVLKDQIFSLIIAKKKNKNKHMTLKTLAVVVVMLSWFIFGLLLKMV